MRCTRSFLSSPNLKFNRLARCSNGLCGPGLPQPICWPTAPQEIGFAGANQLIRVERHYWEGQEEEPEVEVRFGVVSLLVEQAGPHQLSGLAREHWSIENGNHYRRDRTFDEDRCPVRDPNGAALLASLRSWAIFIFLQQKAHQERPARYSLPKFQREMTRHQGRAVAWVANNYQPP